MRFHASGLCNDDVGWAGYAWDGLGSCTEKAWIAAFAAMTMWDE